MGWGWRRWALVSPDGVVPSQMVDVSASVNLPLHHKVQKFSSGTGSPGWARKWAVKQLCGVAVIGRGIVAPDVEELCINLLLAQLNYTSMVFDRISYKCVSYLASMCY